MHNIFVPSCDKAIVSYWWKVVEDNESGLGFTQAPEVVLGLWLNAKSIRGCIK
jgi:hypothetical protein